MRYVWHNVRYTVFALIGLVLVGVGVSIANQDVPELQCTQARINTGGATSEFYYRPRSGSFTVLRFGQGDACWYYSSGW